MYIYMCRNNRLVRKRKIHFFLTHTRLGKFLQSFGISSNLLVSQCILKNRGM